MSAYPELEPLDPLDLKDYTVDWTDKLTALSDTIASVAWTVIGATNDHATNDTLTATIWLDTGVLGYQAVITCKITTAAGRVLNQSFTVEVKDL